MRDLIARTLLQLMLRNLLRSQNALNRLAGRAILVQLKKISDEEFRGDLDTFYSSVGIEWLKKEINFNAKRDFLLQSGGYKVDVLRLCSDTSDHKNTSRLPLWERRFALMRRMGVRWDVLALRRTEQIPPHAHYRVVSGFYVLSGAVGIRHYDRVKEQSGQLVIKKAVDTILDAGGYTTNSEYYHNIHWLAGVAPISVLFRVTVTDTPSETFGGVKRANSRTYVDPSGAADISGLILAPYISESEAKKLAFTPDRSGSCATLLK